MQILAKGISHDEGLAKLKEFIPQYGNGGHNYAMLMERPDGTLEVEAHPHSPCWGNTRRYKSKSNRPFDYYPGDLPTPMGPGRPIAGALPLNIGGAIDERVKIALDLVTDKESPYREIFRDYEVVLNDKNHGGFLFKDTKYDSTVQASMMMNLRNYLGHKWKLLKELSDVHPGLRFHFLTDQNPFLQQGAYTNSWTSSVHPSWTMRRLIKGEPVGLSNGTWYDERDYNRPFIHYLFADYVHPDNYPGSVDWTTNHQDDQNKLNGEWAQKADADLTTAHTMMRDILGTLGVIDEAGIIAKRKEIEHEVFNRC
jgi:hypothetical protein